MEHAAPHHSYEPDFPWRRIAVLALTIAAAELVVLVALGVVALAPSGGTAAATPDRTPKPRARVKQKALPPHKVLAPAQTRVLVLNGNGLAGAAASEAKRVRGAGYRINGVGNAERMAGGPTVVMYRPHFQVEGQRLGQALRIPVVAPLDGMLVSGLRGAHLVVVVGG
ncbi:MAG: LytR C-terminal domain-containing protein [Actinomycetota bacterium]|nr:LytR C-terminal domain-containing protein [Actinomycetota bacterium]MDQ2982540.1 LytR C-terminal domain-containing protein [Actinomycetota bacterium]